MLQQIADRCGPDAARRVAEELGGQRVYLPAPERLVAGHRLVEQLGRDLARALPAVLGRGEIAVPRGAGRRRRIVIPPELAQASANRIAARLGCCARAVERARQRLRNGS